MWNSEIAKIDDQLEYAIGNKNFVEELFQYKTNNVWIEDKVNEGDDTFVT